MKRTREKKLDLLRWRLLDAIERGRLDRVHRLLNLGLNVNTLIGYESLTPLMEAVKNGQAEIARALLKRGAQVKARTDWGDTALSLACGQRRRMIRLLIRAGANIESRDGAGHTPLMMAAAGSGDTYAIEVLLEAGADIGAVDERGNTAFLFACAGGHIGAARLLLEQGADPHARTESHTALGIAAYGGHTAMLQFLLEQGLDVNEATDDGNTVFQSALAGDWISREMASRQLDSILQILKEAGAHEGES